MYGKWLSLAWCAFALGACDPYDRFVGDSSAGAVDPVNFPAAYLGTGGVGSMPGGGVMNAVVAQVADMQIGYYSFPYDGIDLSLSTDGVLSAPIAYDFDEDGTTHCTPPDGYVYDQQRDDVRYDEQGNIFVELPDAEGYRPVIADVTVHSMGLPCQDTKSESTVVARTDVKLDLLPPMFPDEPNAHPTGKPSGTYLARVVIDPSIDVRFPDGSVDPNTGLGPQKWGWYQRYLLAYLDGGVIPAFDTTVLNASAQSQHVTEMKPQQLYFPTMHPGDDGMGNKVPVGGVLGDGFDVLTAARGTDGYSPLCEVFSFVPANPMKPETDVAAIDAATVQNTGGFVWCIQVAK